MRDIPQVITPAILAANAGKTDDQIQEDIDLTRAEITALRHVESAYLLLAEHHLSPNQRQINRFLADAQPKEMSDRADFVEFLQKLLAARKGKRCSVMSAVVVPE